MSSSSAARPLRWLVVGPFSAAPTGHVTAVAGERFATVMGKVAPRVDLDVDDRIGSERTRRIAVVFSRPRSFRAAEIVAQDDRLRQLEELAGRLAQGRGEGDPAAAVERIVGPGRLADALRGDTRAAEPAADAPASSEPTETSGAPAPADPDEETPPEGVDAIFAKADLAPAPTVAGAAAKSGLDAFIGAVRSKGSSTSTPAQRDRGADAAATIRGAVQATVDAVLEHPAFRDAEIAWRALSMIVSAAPGADDMAIDLLDASPSALSDAIGHALDRPGLDRADAVFVTSPIADVDTARALADVAAARHVPIVVEIPAALAGLDLGATTQPDVPEPWTELRAHASTRWLCAAVNPPALYEEPDPHPRVRFGGAAAALAAMCAASVARTAAPGDILGRSGAFTTPAAHDVEIRGDCITIPTEIMCALDGQRAAASRGVIVLGSEPGRPQIRLAAAPTVGGDADDPGLAGRILAGRATRLAQQVRQSLPSASPDELEAALAEASGRFLPKIDRGAVALRVRMDGDETTVDGSIGAALAGASFKFSSDV